MVDSENIEAEPTPPEGLRAVAPSPRLDILKALGDNTRYAIYLELARSNKPLSTNEIAEGLNLHVNTVRPHLERMREVGLLDVRSSTSGGVGRPQHLYGLAIDAPSLGLEPSPYPVIARMLLRLAELAGTEAEVALEAGREQGALNARPWPGGAPVVEAMMTDLDSMGFDPEIVIEQDASSGTDVAAIAFSHCPFADLAKTNPTVVCALHRGMVEGFLAGIEGPELLAFHTLVDRDPCQVEIPVR